MNVSEFVFKRLAEWGLTRVYGYPGDGMGGLDVAIERARDTIDYIQVRHEEMAAFMACGHAKFTGQVIVGQQARTAIGAHYQQELDLQTLFKDVAGDFVATASVPSQVRHLIDRGKPLVGRHPACSPGRHPVHGAAERVE